MKVTVVCFGALREHLPDPSNNSAVLELDEGASVADVAQALSIPNARLHVALIDGDKVGSSTRVQDGAEVTLMPAFSGGASTQEEFP